MSSPASGTGRIENYDTEWGVKKDPRAVIHPTTCVETSNVDENAETVDVAIVGGGLAGLAAAVGLTRHGINCHVYERAPHIRSVSQGMLLVAQNGLWALEQLNPKLPDLVASAGSPLLETLMETIKEDGTTDVRRTDGSAFRGDDGRQSVLIRWHALQQVMASLVDPEIISTGKSLTSFHEDENEVVLRFEDGAVVKCEAALACDGTFSVARKHILPDDAPIFFGQLNWNAIVPTTDSTDKFHPPNSVRAISHPHEPRWSVFMNDCGGNHTFWQLRVSDPDKALALSGSDERGGLGLAGVKEKLLSVASSSPDVTNFLTSLQEEQIFERCIIARGTARMWRSSGGRVALLGDVAHAMHPMVGQGGNSAFESAVAAVKAICENRNDPKAGLELYEKRRKPKADHVQRYSNLMGCQQSSGAQVLNAKTRKQILDWINVVDKTEILPKDIADILESFDPLTHPGVSPLV